MSDSYEAARQAAEIERVRQKNAPFTTDLAGMTLRSGKRIKFNDADGTAGLSLQCAPTMAANVTLTLPSVAPTAGQVLRGNASVPTTLEWAAPEDLGTLGDGMTNPMTTLYDMIIGDVGGVPIRLPAGGPNTELITTVDGQVGWAARGMTNPMTTEGDLIYRDATGPTRLGIGTNGHVLKSNGTTVTWTAENADVGFANPMTTAGDVIVGGASGTPSRLATGSSNQVLTSDGAGGVSWTTPSSGMTNPMTTAGDVMYGGASGTPTRLGVPGTNPGNRALLLNNGATACVWSGYGLHGTNDSTTSLLLGGGTNVATGNKAVLLGYGVSNTATGDAMKVMIGYNSGASTGVAQSYCVAVGNETSVGQYGTAIGPNATNTAGYGFAAGSTALAGTYGVAIGMQSVAGGNAVALGLQATTTGSSGVAIGIQTNAAEEAVAVGGNAAATTKNVAIGKGAIANSANASGSGATVAIGYGATTSTYPNCVALGCASSVTAGQGHALGNQCIAHDGALSAGFYARAEQNYSMALGRYSHSTGTNGIAIGNEAAAHTGSVIIGNDCNDNSSTAAPVATGAIMLGTGIRAFQYSAEAVQDPVLVGYHANRGRKVRGGVCVMGGYASRAASAGSDSGYFIRDSTILGHGLYKDVSADIDKVVMIGANGKELIGGTIPTTAFNHATAEGTAQSTTADGTIDLYGKLRLWKTDRSGYCLLDYGSGGSTLAASKYVWSGSAWVVDGTPGSVTIA